MAGTESGKEPGASRQPSQAQLPPGDAARLIMRRALKASLATLEASSGHPYASLVTIATDVDGTPLLLISTLALHTRNLNSDARASLLFDGTDASGDPLAGGRVTVIGRAVKTERASARERFLGRHQTARGYADFPDFAFYELQPERAHFIGGFGRIVDLAPSEFLINTDDSAGLISAHADIVSHMNDDHAAALALCATELAGAPGGPWRMSGIDPEGFDIVCDGTTCRLPFTIRVTTPDEARQELVRLAALARDQKSKR